MKKESREGEKKRVSVFVFFLSTCSKKKRTKKNGGKLTRQLLRRHLVPEKEAPSRQDYDRLDVPDDVVRQRTRRPNHQESRQGDEQSQTSGDGDGDDCGKAVREAQDRVRVWGDSAGLANGLPDQHQTSEHRGSDGSVLVEQLHRPGPELALLGAGPDLVRGRRGDRSRSHEQPEQGGAAVPCDQLRVGDGRQGDAGADNADGGSHGPRRALPQEDGLGRQDCRRHGDFRDLVEPDGVELEVEVVEDDVSDVGCCERGESLFGEDLLLVDAFLRFLWEGKRKKEEDEEKKVRRKAAQGGGDQRENSLSTSPAAWNAFIPASVVSVWISVRA